MVISVNSVQFAHLCTEDGVSVQTVRSARDTEESQHRADGAAGRSLLQLISGQVLTKEGGLEERERERENH